MMQREWVPGTHVGNLDYIPDSRLSLPICCRPFGEWMNGWRLSFHFSVSQTLCLRIIIIKKYWLHLRVIGKTRKIKVKMFCESGREDCNLGCGITAVEHSFSASSWIMWMNIHLALQFIWHCCLNKYRKDLGNGNFPENKLFNKLFLLVFSDGPCVFCRDLKDRNELDPVFPVGSVI